jgi:hypothetical protein
MVAAELWRPIPEFPGYEASDHWSLRSIDRVDNRGQSRRGRTLTQYRPTPRHRQLHVTLSVDGVKYTRPVDSLVLSAWDPQQVRSFPRKAAA